MEKGIHLLDVVQTNIAKYAQLNVPHENERTNILFDFGEKGMYFPSEEEQNRMSNQLMDDNPTFLVQKYKESPTYGGYDVPQGTIEELKKFDWLPLSSLNTPSIVWYAQKDPSILRTQADRDALAHVTLYRAIVASHIENSLVLDDYGSFRIKNGLVKLTEGSAMENNGHGNFVGHTLIIKDAKEMKKDLFTVTTYTLEHHRATKGYGIHDPFFT